MKDWVVIVILALLSIPLWMSIIVSIKYFIQNQRKIKSLAPGQVWRTVFGADTNNPWLQPINIDYKILDVRPGRNNGLYVKYINVKSPDQIKYITAQSFIRDAVQIQE